MKVLTPKEMKELDRFTCEEKKISSLQLMEEAGKKIYECLLEERNIEISGDKITIVAGPGNNGGDALVVARYLVQDHFKVEVVMVGKGGNITQETKENLKKLMDLGVNPYFFEDLSFYPSFEKLLQKSTLIIEGIFGIGLNRKVEGLYGKAMDGINKSTAYIVSIDIPSGIGGENGCIFGTSIEADLTIVVQNFKSGNLLNDAKDTHGKYRLIDIGILQRDFSSKRYVLRKEDFQGKLPKRKKNSHKYHYGSVLIVGGSTGMTGAPIMSAFSALRTGCGLSTIGIQEKYLNNIYQPYPEIMLRPYSSLREWKELVHKKQAIAFGPGLGRRNDFNYQVLRYLLETTIPLIIDADGLYYLKGLLDDIKERENLIITPHYGEMAMLLDTSSEQIENNPLGAIKEITHKYAMGVVLKGPCTLIAQGNEIYFNTLGNPGMATAGSGDVLTGIISSLVGQGLNGLDACKLGVYLHSLAGDLAAKEIGENSLMATDIIRYLPKAYKCLM